MNKLSYLFISGIFICIALLIYYSTKIVSNGISALESHPVFSVVMILVGLVMALYYSVKNKGN